MTEASKNIHFQYTSFFFFLRFGIYQSMPPLNPSAFLPLAALFLPSPSSYVSPCSSQLFRRVAAALPGMESLDDANPEGSILSRHRLTEPAAR